ncbi:MAG: reverse transcriptase-like protein [Acetatifactor sp.]|nr:reverse transcriptase-like protein [Acetatifactor sp.]
MGAENTLTAYVDGSYNDELKRYAFGCVFLPPQGGIYLAMGNGENPDTVSMRNVTGEMLGAMYAVKTAMKNGFTSVDIYYDYEGIEKWVTGDWKAKKDHTKKYAEAMRTWATQIKVSYHKVTAHAKVEYNELADKTAKRALEEAKGVPPIRMLEELETWN